MPRYLLFWEMDNTRTPTDPKERGSQWQKLLGTTKEDLEKGLMKDWGATPGESRGYCIAEGSEAEISLMTQKYIPYVRFKTYPVMDVHQTESILREMAK